MVRRSFCDMRLEKMYSLFSQTLCEKFTLGSIIETVDHGGFVMWVFRLIVGCEIRAGSPSAAASDVDVEALGVRHFCGLLP